MRHQIINKILTEWSYRVNDGMPNPKNPLHLIHLKESLEHLKIDEEVIDMMMNKLMEDKDDKYVSNSALSLKSSSLKFCNNFSVTFLGKLNLLSDSSR